jgi:hypothetical protein
MPWTASHPAAVLPLRRFTPQPLNFAALVCGSMAPDLGYYINQFGFATFAHTLPGSFLAALPTGLFFLVVLYLLRRPFCSTLPAPHRQALLPLCKPAPGGLTNWLIIVGCVLLGVWTHNFWDAWTHDTGWFVVRLPFLQQPVFHIGRNTIFLPLCLQVFSTFAGFFILVFAYFKWLARQRRAAAFDPESDAWRYCFWGALVVGSVLCAIPLAIHSAGSKHGYLLGRAIVFRTAIFFADVFLPLSLAAVAIVYFRQRAPR